MLFDSIVLTNQEREQAMQALLGKLGMADEAAPDYWSAYKRLHRQRPAMFVLGMELRKGLRRAGCGAV